MDLLKMVASEHSVSQFVISCLSSCLFVSCLPLVTDATDVILGEKAPQQQWCNDPASGHFRFTHGARSSVSATKYVLEVCSHRFGLLYADEKVGCKLHLIYDVTYGCGQRKTASNPMMGVTHHMLSGSSICLARLISVEFQLRSFRFRLSKTHFQWSRRCSDWIINVLPHAADPNLAFASGI